MTLDEAIKHAEDVARQNEADAIVYSNCKKYKKNLYEMVVVENAEKNCCKCAEEHRQLAEWLKELKRLREHTNVPVTNVGDCISRQAVIDRINKLIEVEKKQGTDDWGYGRERVNAYEAMLHFVKSEYLCPSVEPEKKPGKWEYVQYDGNPKIGNWHCSECRQIVFLLHSQKYNEKPLYDFCPWCGVKMEVDNGKN